jgi:hypothetical protein
LNKVNMLNKIIPGILNKIATAMNKILMTLNKVI